MKQIACCQLPYMPFEHSSIATFRCSPALRHARATALNEGRA